MAERLKAKSKNFSAVLPDRSAHFDVPLTAVTVALLAFGVLMVYSASMYSGEVNYGNEFFFMYKQIFGVLAGLAAMFAMTVVDYHKLAKSRFVILAVSILLLALVLIPGVGIENYGARRWLNLGVITLQSSEVAKVGYVIFAAAYMSRNSKKMTTIRGVFPLIAVGVVICALIMLEPNMSVTMCVALLMLTMLVIGGMRVKHLVMLVVPLAALVVVLIAVEPYRPACIPRPVGFAAGRGVSAAAIVLRTGQRRAVRRGTVQLAPEISVPAVRRKRFHLFGHRRGIRLHRLPDRDRRLLLHDLPSCGHSAERSRPFRLFSLVGHGGADRRPGAHQHSGGHREHSADGHTAAVYQRRVKLAYRLLCRYRNVPVRQPAFPRFRPRPALTQPRGSVCSG